MPGQYDQTLSRQYPGLFVILLDQSESMGQKGVTNGVSKAKIVTNYVNDIIQRMIDIAQVNELSGRRKNYAYVSILGYNDKVYPLLSKNLKPLSLPDLDDQEKGMAPSERLIMDQSGKIIRRIQEKHRFWIEPEAKGQTDMTLAFEEAERVIQNWLSSPPEPISREQGAIMQMPRHMSFPPILINITDAKHNGRRDPDEVIERIGQMKTDHGHVLIYNCHITHESVQPCCFPPSIVELQHYTREKQAERLFYMSSEMPDILLHKGEQYMRMPITPGSRCFVYNANPDILLKFLQWTTLGKSEDRGR